MINQIISWIQESTINKWIAILCSCFLFQSFVETLGWLTNLPFEELLFNFFGLQNNFSWKIHSLLTYAFLHNGFFHFLFNVFTFYFSAYLLHTFWRGNQIIRLFLAGILFGGISSLIASTLMQKPVIIVGASAGIFSILFAATRFSPRMSIYLFGVIKVPLWLISLSLTLISVTGLNGSNFGGEWAHLGGGLLGFLIAKNPESLNLKNHKKKISSPLKLKKLFRKKSFNSLSIDEKEMDSAIERSKYLNEILDKINDNGYENLNKKEKVFLEKYGEK